MVQLERVKWVTKASNQAVMVLKHTTLLRKNVLKTFSCWIEKNGKLLGTENDAASAQLCLTTDIQKSQPILSASFLKLLINTAGKPF